MYCFSPLGCFVYHFIVVWIIVLVLLFYQEYKYTYNNSMYFKKLQMQPSKGKLVGFVLFLEGSLVGEFGIVITNTYPSHHLKEKIKNGYEEIRMTG